MLMPVRGRIGALVALCLGVCTSAAHAAAPPQGYESDDAFAASYAAHHVTGVLATAQRVSCYTPEVYVTLGLSATQGYPQGGGTPCPGATTGENTGPYPSQNVGNAPLLVKEHSESDLHVDPTDARHLIGVSKWFVNGEGYNHLTGFFESFDGGETWPQQGHIPGFEGWTDNSDPVGAFDPWGNFYAFVLAYAFEYDSVGNHIFLSPRVNPALPRSVVGIAVRKRGAASAAVWLTIHAGNPDYVATAPFNGESTFDKQWMAIDTNRKSRHFGRIYLSWAIGDTDSSLRIYSSHADAHPDGTHTNWTRPTLVLQQAPGSGDNGSLPHVAPDGTVWLETSSFSSDGAGPFIASLTSSRDGGATWSRRRVIVRHLPSGYDNTTFRAAFGEAFAVGPRRVGKFFPLYLAYENGPNGPVRIYVTASFDNGRHWRKPIIVNDNRNGGEALQPGLAVSPSGTVVVSFYDRRLRCAAHGSAEATGAGLGFDPLAPFDKVNFCVNTAVQLYRPGLRPIGHNIRMSPHTWDPQLSAPRFLCICNPRATFIGDYFGVDALGGFAYTSSVTTYNENGENPLFHQQQLVSKLQVP
jgi:BNR repeat-like domain